MADEMPPLDGEEVVVPIPYTGDEFTQVGIAYFSAMGEGEGGGSGIPESTIRAWDTAILTQARAYVDEKPIYEAIEVDEALTLEVQAGVMYELTGTGDMTLSGPLGTVAAIAQSGGVTINGAPVVRLSVVTRLADGWEVLAAGGGGSV